MKRTFLAVVGFVVALAAGAQPAVIEGRGYLDANRNGMADANESGVAQVPVSDGVRVTVTDAAGGYRLETPDASAPIWVCVPRDHVSSGPFWRIADGLRREDFGLIPQAQTDDFLLVQMTDTHIGRDDLLKRFAGHLGQQPLTAMVAVNTGDLVAGVDVVLPEKARAQIDRYLGAAAAFRIRSGWSAREENL